jgi:membrane-associated phospholipid phosphatase
MGMEQHITLTDIPISSDDPRIRIARWISNILSPPVFGLLFLLLVGMAQPTTADQLWILFYMGVAILLPIGYIFWLLKKKQITDFHIKMRRQRYKPMFVLFLCSIFSWGVMRLGSASIVMQTVAVMGAVLIAFLFLITLRWKISGHAIAVSAFTIFCISVWGVLALPVLLLVPIVIWSRLALKRHSFAQTAVGTVVGGLFVIITQYSIVVNCSGVTLSCG